MKIWILILSVGFAFNAMAETKTYECGEHCTATLDTETGVMRVSGTGEMTGYDDETRDQTPWFADRLKIKEVVVEEGITKVGFNAFFYCGNIKTIELAKSVQKVDVAAFDEDYKVQSVTMYDSTVWSNQADFNSISISPDNIKINCYGDLDKCKTNFLNTRNMKSAANFNYKGKKIYTIDEANKVTGERNRVSIKYR